MLRCVVCNVTAVTPGGKPKLENESRLIILTYNHHNETVLIIRMDFYIHKKEMSSASQSFPADVGVDQISIM